MVVDGNCMKRELIDSPPPMRPANRLLMPVKARGAATSLKMRLSLGCRKREPLIVRVRAGPVRPLFWFDPL